MSTITMQLLQTPQILLDDVPVALPFKKAEGLLYYMALHKSISRETAASLFWADNDEQTAKKNLRHTLYTIKKVFQQEIIVSPQKQTLSLNPEMHFVIDYDLFINENQLDLYKGEFLEGFYVKNASEFEQWLESERVTLKDTYIRKLYDHMSQLPKDHIFELENCFALYTREDPLDERAYYLMMQAYQSNHLYHKGIKIYQNLSKLLNTELRISPSKELAELHRELLNAWTEATAEEAEAVPVSIIGRSREVQFLTQMYHSLLSERPSSVFLTGENGVGKSYLMNHFLDSLKGDACLVLRAICFHAEKDFPLQPWNSIMLQIDTYLTEHQIQVPERYLNAISTMFPLMGVHNPLTHVPEDIRISYNYRVARNSIIKLFSLIGEEIPIILSFDNIHYMDAMSRELLSVLLRERNPNIMVLGTCLDVLKPEIHSYVNTLLKEQLVQPCKVERFSKDSVIAYVKERFGEHAVNDMMVDMIYKETEGNAFFLEILLNKFTERSLPGSISVHTQDILSERLEEVSPHARQILDIISLFHDYATLEIIEFISNMDTLEILDLLDELKQYALIEETMKNNVIQFKFRHNKMQEFVHSQLSPSKRRILHSRVASYLEQTELPRTPRWYQQIVFHYTLCGNEPKVLQYRILELEAFSTFNFDLYPILGPQSDVNSETPHQLISTLDELTGKLSKLYHLHPHAIDYAEAEARLMLLSGKYYISQGSYEKGVPAIRHVLRENAFAKEHPEFYIQCLRQMTFYGIQVLDTELMYENITQGMQMAREHRLETEYAIECRLYGLYLLYIEDYAAAQDYLLKSIELFKKTPLKAQSFGLNIAACYNYLGEVYRRQMQFENALQHYQNAIALCSQYSCPVSATFYTNLARTYLDMGQKFEGEEALKDACRIYDDTSTLMGRSIAKGYYSFLKAEKGQWEQSYVLLNEAMLAAPRLSSPLELGLLAKIKLLLLQTYPEKFSDIITSSPEVLEEEIHSYLDDLPGTYEKNENYPFL